eukprot:CAMPEP_0116895494 /NCGR_PEP_ID=MMETSP0467-20121206/5006_1 /TAXON_ID=283647 /ORGANISM="Mesodinium pulex, Strain SPMC105" /LENGTH=388 /DNA_ID=CAMNT_0004566257 /DNA_START=772 /DNA_END=1938 /DNA_ORIENTATION=+
MHGLLHHFEEFFRLFRVLDHVFQKVGFGNLFVDQLDLGFLFGDDFGPKVFVMDVEVTVCEGAGHKLFFVHTVCAFEHTVALGLGAVGQNLVNVFFDLSLSRFVALVEYALGSSLQQQLQLFFVVLVELFDFTIHFGKGPGRKHCFVQTQLLAGSVEHFGFIGVVRNQPVDCDVILLPDSVCTSCGLQVVLRIPVGVEDDDSGCTGQVDAHTSSFSRQQKDLHPLIEVIEVFNAFVPLGHSDATVQSLLRNALMFHVFLQDVQDQHELRENQHFLVFRPQFRQKFVQENELAAAFHEFLHAHFLVVVNLGHDLVLHSLEQPGVVADVAQLHLDVAEHGEVQVARLDQIVSVFLLNHPLLGLLSGGQLYVDYSLLERGDGVLLLESPQQE